MKKQWMMVMVLVGLLWPCADGVAEDMDMSIFADILYPSKVYYFFSSGKIAKVWPENAFKRFSEGEEFAEIDFWFHRVQNQFRYWLLPFMFVPKPYRRLYVKEFYTDHGGKRTMFLKDATFKLPDKVVYWEDPETGWCRSEPDCGYYYNNYGGAKPENPFKGWPKYNFGRLFKKYGTEGFTTTIVYRFDDEEEKTLVTEYEIREVDWQYRSWWWTL